MEGIGALHSFLPDIQGALCEAFSSAECSMEKTPDLAEPPFNFAFHSMGSKLYLLPPNSTPPKDYHQLASVTEGEIVCDTTPGDTIHLLLEGGDDWRTPIQKYFNKALGTEWYFVAMELQSGIPKFSIFSPHSKSVKSSSPDNLVWLAPVSSAPAPATPDAPAKPKTVKKVLVKKSSDKTATDKTTTKVAKSSSGTKVVRKKVVSKDGSNSSSSDVKEKLTNGVKKASPERILKVSDEPSKSEAMNGEGSGADSGVSVADSDNEKSQKTEASSPTEDVAVHSVFIEQLSMPTSETGSLKLKPDSSIESDFTDKHEDTVITKEKNDDFSFTAKEKDDHFNVTTKVKDDELKFSTKQKDDDFCTSFTMRLAEQLNGHDTSRTESRKMERILEEEEKPRPEDSINGDAFGTKDYGLLYGTSSKRETSEEDERFSREQSSTSSRLSPPSEASGRDVTIQEKGSKERHSSPALTHIREVIVRNRVEIPVQVLQQVLKRLSYKELGELRMVHPHWDELCGQALNQAYYDIVKRANELLTECQRRVPIERDLHDALSVLTNVQVHILNPVDILRPAMDEGVCCFPYGELLDKICIILAKVERNMKGEYDLFINWKPVAELAKQAQMHYKTRMESVMEEKLGDVFRLKALQQIQRIDSFMIDSTVNKLEKAAHMARDDLEWEMEQLRQQNNQLRKDNRELKKEYMRLESRVEVLEGKLKTMARLLA